MVVRHIPSYSSYAQQLESKVLLMNCSKLIVVLGPIKIKQKKMKCFVVWSFIIIKCSFLEYFVSTFQKVDYSYYILY